MKINIQYLLITFYILLTGSTGYLLIENIESSIDPVALLFQIVIIGVCLTGLIGIAAGLKFSKKFNRIFLWVINGFFGLALINAITFGELHLITIRELILYAVLGTIDSIILIRLVNRYKKKQS